MSTPAPQQATQSPEMYAQNATSATYYEDGDIVEKEWHLVFIFMAFVAAYIGSYSAIRLLEHSLWRSDRERANASSITSKYPLLSTAFVLGLSTIWSMHFIGMQAVTLKNVNMRYNPVETFFSLVLSILGVWIGMTLASRDVFNGPDRLSKLKEMLKNNRNVASKNNRRRASRQIHQIAFFSNLHWIFLGSLWMASGALAMHYLGMYAMKGPFIKEWNILYLSASVLVGVLVSFVGFWILFRPLHWKVEKSWYRHLAAGTIGLAVCVLHFLGMRSVTYVYAHDADGGGSYKKELQGWDTHQLMVLFVSMVVPSVAFYIEHTISNELRITYRQLLNIRLTRSEFETCASGALSIASKSKRTVRISGMDFSQPSSESVWTDGSLMTQKQRFWDRCHQSGNEKKDVLEEEVEEEEQGGDDEAVHGIDGNCHVSSIHSSSVLTFGSSVESDTGPTPSSSSSEAASCNDSGGSDECDIEESEDPPDLEVGQVHEEDRKRGNQRRMSRRVALESFRLRQSSLKAINASDPYLLEQQDVPCLDLDENGYEEHEIDPCPDLKSFGNSIPSLAQIAKNLSSGSLEKLGGEDRCQVAPESA